MSSNKPYILGIDTSCDETSFAILNQNTKEVLSNTVSSQVKLHAPYGGVVPELASRSHVENISPVFQQALDDAKIKKDDIGAIAVTKTPGLIGCLLTGACFARALAYQSDIPLYGVNHLSGHLLSPFIDQKPLFPCLGLVVSGGHTTFYRIDSFDEISILGQTVDDAAGEAFDKCAKMLGLGYPGGPIVDKLAQKGDPKAFSFTIAKVKIGEQYLSFSGLKTALYYHIEKLMGEKKVEPKDLPEEIKKDLCASLQQSIVQALTKKMEYFFSQTEFKSFALSGGVALNSELRKRAQEVCDKNAMPCYIAAPRYCSDNGAMIAHAALVQKHEDERNTLNVQASKKIQARKLKAKQ